MADVGRVEEVFDCKETTDGVGTMLPAALEDGNFVARGDCTRDEMEAVVGDSRVPLPEPL
jgi:hypothetical protein